MNVHSIQTKLRTFRFFMLMMLGDHPIVTDANANLSRKKNGQVDILPESEVRAMAKKLSISFSDAVHYIVMSVGAPVVGPGDLPRVVIRDGYRELYMEYSGKCPTRIPGGIQVTIDGIYVPRHSTKVNGEPEIMAPTIFANGSEGKDNHIGLQIATKLHEFMLENLNEFNVFYRSTNGFSGEPTTMQEINANLSVYGDQIIVKHEGDGIYKSCSYDPQATRVFLAIVMCAGSGKTTLASKLRKLVIDIDDVYDFDQGGEERAAALAAMKRKDWPTVSKIQSKIFDDFMKRRPDCSERIFLIHHPGSFVGTFRPAVLGVFRPVLGELLNEATRRMDAILNFDRADVIIGGRRGTVHPAVKYHLSTKVGEDQRYCVDGSTLAMLRFPDDGLVHFRNGDVESADDYELPLGQSIHAMDGPAAATYDVFSHEEYYKAKFTYNGKVFAIMDNRDERTAGEGNVFDHFIRSLVHIIEEDEPMKHAPRKPKAKFGVYDMVTKEGEIFKFIIYLNSWGHNFDSVDDEIAVIWSKNELNIDHVPHSAYLKRKAKLPNSTYQIINDDYHPKKGSSKGKFLSDYLDDVSRMVEDALSHGHRIIHLWIQGTLHTDVTDVRKGIHHWDDIKEAVIERLTLTEEEGAMIEPVITIDDVMYIRESLLNNWESLEVQPMFRNEIIEIVSRLSMFQPYKMDSRLYHGRGSIITTLQGAFGVGRRPNQVAAQTLERHKSGIHTSGHLIASVTAFRAHMIWYFYEVYLNIITNSTIYHFPFAEPEGGLYHTFSDYTYTLQFLNDLIWQGDLPKYAAKHVALMETLFDTLNYRGRHLN